MYEIEQNRLLRELLILAVVRKKILKCQKSNCRLFPPPYLIMYSRASKSHPTESILTYLVCVKQYNVLDVFCEIGSLHSCNKCFLCFLTCLLQSMNHLLVWKLCAQFPFTFVPYNHMLPDLF